MFRPRNRLKNRMTMRNLTTRLLPFILLGSLAAEEPATRSLRVATMEKIADYALIPPALNTSPLPEYGYDKLDYGMTIGIERTRGGRLWACWVAGGDSPKAFFVLATSDDIAGSTPWFSAIQGLLPRTRSSAWCECLRLR